MDNDAKTIINLESWSRKVHFQFFSDSCPKISFGKITEENNIKSMPVSVHAHHGLVEGFHVGQFFKSFQDL